MSAPAHEVALVGTAVPERLGLQTRAYNPAGARFQLNLAHGLHRLMPHRLCVISTQPAVAFPRGDRPLVRGSRHTLDESGLELQLLSFVNVIVLKEFTVALAIFRELLAWMRATPGARRTIIVYNVFSPFSLAVLAAARVMNAKAVAIVADLPHSMYRFRRVKGVLERIDFLVQTRVIRYFDGVIALTRQISDDFAYGTPSLVLEGGIDRFVHEPEDTSGHDGQSICMFSGTLNAINGVSLLLQAFDLLNDASFRLWIFGGGELENDVREAARRDARITYFGAVPNADVRRHQRQATLLVNPRFSKNEITRYTFPSKLLEYMASGRPVLTTVLPGVPDEYYRYVYQVGEETPEGLATAIRETCTHSAEQLGQTGRRARDFVLREKSWATQAERVHRFIEGLWNGAAKR